MAWHSHSHVKKVAAVCNMEWLGRLGCRGTRSAGELIPLTVGMKRCSQTAWDGERIGRPSVSDSPDSATTSPPGRLVFDRKRRLTREGIGRSPAARGASGRLQTHPPHPLPAFIDPFFVEKMRDIMGLYVNRQTEPWWFRAPMKGAQSAFGAHLTAVDGSGLRQGHGPQVLHGKTINGLGEPQFGTGDAR
jgi:hypothetical protein